MRIEPEIIVRAILSAPGWARIGITAPVERLRVDAAHEIARSILTEPDNNQPDDNQLTLSL